MSTAICCRAFVFTLLLNWANVVLADDRPGPRDEAYPLRPGPHLFLDDFLIEHSDAIERRVMSPQRSLDGPVITAASGHLNWQPWLTVLYDPARPEHARFRVWFDADVVPDTTDKAYQTKLGYLESADGVHWPGPPRFLERTDSILFGASVLSDGPNFSPSAERYKLLYYAENRGPVVAFSPDGLKWTVHDSGHEIIKPSPGDDSWHAGYDPLRRRYFLFGKSNQIHQWTNSEGQSLSQRLRLFGTAVSDDFKIWTDLKIQFAPDAKDPGVTEGYAVTGFQVRGDLLFGFFQVLRDDLTAEGAPPEAVSANPRGTGGMRHTVLCWTRDGQTWHRDRERDAFLTPSSKVGSWDHAVAWVSSVVPVSDEVFVYYAGYCWGHKYRRAEDRQVGLVKLPRDRYVAREASQRIGTLTTRPLILHADSLTLNADASEGEVRVQVCDALRQPLPGFSFADCTPVTTDSLVAPVSWQRPLGDLKGKTVRLQFSLRKSRLFALDAK